MVKSLIIVFGFCLSLYFAMDNTSASSSTTGLPPDPCTDYKELDEPQRSTAYTQEGLVFCDETITEQWYRSVSGAGSDMPTTPVPIGRCGTVYPIWMNDTFPTLNEEKVVKVCVTTFLSDCNLEFEIKMKNCSGFNTYYLTPAHGCPIAYCFVCIPAYINFSGSYLRCPANQTSPNGFYPGCRNYTDTGHLVPVQHKE